MPAPVLGNHGSSTSTGGTTTTISVTSAANSVVLVFCTVGGISTSVASSLTAAGAGLTWTAVDTSNAARGPGVNGFYFTVQVFWAFTASALSAQTVTITSSQTIDDAATVYATYTGAYAAAPIDANSGAIKASFNTTPNQLAMSSTNANDVAVVAGGSNLNVGQPSGFASGSSTVDFALNVGGVRYANCSVAQRSFSAPQTNVIVGWTSSSTPGGYVGVMLTADPPPAAFTTWSTTDKSASMTLSGGNLIATAGAALQSVRAVHPKRTGKYYIEYNVGTVSNGTQIGFGTAATPFGVSGALTQSFTVQGNGSTNTAFDSFGVQITGLGFQAALVTSVLLCAAIDLDNALIWFRVGAAAVWNNSASNNPATGVGGISMVRTGLGTPGMDVYPFLVLGNTSNAVTANFGASAFTGAVPAGFTSGWDDSVAVVTNEIVTQVGVEEWGSSVPAMQATQVGIEQWGSSANPIAVTQVSAEHWAAASPDAAVTQALVEHWGTVSAISTQAVVTQVLVEHWVPAAVVSTARPRRLVCISG
jgi:hypothetical protein